MDNSNDFATGLIVGENRNGNGYGNNWGNNGMFGMEWIFALLILPMLWGGNGPFGRNGGGNPVTEADLCQSQSFAELKGSVGRGFDQQTQLAFQNQRDMCQSTATLSAQIAANAAAQERCCCETKGLIQQTQYEAAQNTAAINANVTAQVQKVLDAICGNRMADMQNQINQLQLQAAVSGVVKYPMQTTYATNCNPFFGGFGNWNNGCGCNTGCGCGNI